MVNQNYTRIDANHCVYVRKFLNSKFIMLLLYKDDIYGFIWHQFIWLFAENTIEKS
jgi:hypothetical protein